MVLSEGFRLISFGVAGGVALALVVSKFLRSFLFGVEPTDPMTLAAGAVLFAVVASAALWIPARQAAAVDPIDALRCYE